MKTLDKNLSEPIEPKSSLNFNSRTFMQNVVMPLMFYGLLTGMFCGFTMGRLQKGQTKEDFLTELATDVKVLPDYVEKGMFTLVYPAVELADFLYKRWLRINFNQQEK